jgi:hypothetical protein
VSVVLNGRPLDAAGIAAYVATLAGGYGRRAPRAGPELLALLRDELRLARDAETKEGRYADQE